jgi:hypothetical protein
MDCRRVLLSATVSAATAFTALMPQSAAAQQPGRGRTAYNPVTRQAEPDTRYESAPRARRVSVPVQKQQYQEPQPEELQSPVQQASHCACESGHSDFPGYGEAPSNFGCDSCGDTMCGDPMCGDPCCGDGICLGNGRRSPWQCYGGFEATFLKPHFGSNNAYTVTNNTANTSSSAVTDFKYDLEFSPRVFVGWNRDCDDLGFRATWWHFDHSANAATGNPPSNGLGELTPPSFGDVDLSSNVPTDSFTATTGVNAYTLDIEATKATQFRAWQFGVGGGFRYARIEQDYVGVLSDSGDDVLSNVAYEQSIQGFGPTFSLEAFRTVNCDSGLFAKARGSVLFGDSKSRMVAGEDLSLTTPFITNATTASDDILTICELQVGYRWQAPASSCRLIRPFGSVALEGQMWDGAGNASSQDGNMGFFGFNSAVGINW